jgi:pSer/pThr/pTyr-binding forkhead associated (FHA) protein
MKSLLIGRSQDCDILILHPTVGRRHAELISDKDTRFLLVDCDSTNGTFVWRKDAWLRISSQRVDLQDRIRFGQHETFVHQLVVAAAANHRQRSEPRPEHPQDSRATGPAVERDPETGKIVERRKT